MLIEIPNTVITDTYFLAKDDNFAYLKAGSFESIITCFDNFIFGGKKVTDVFDQAPDNVKGIIKVTPDKKVWCIRKQLDKRRKEKYHGLFESNSFSGKIVPIPEYILKEKQALEDAGHINVRLEYYNYGSRMELLYDVMEKDIDLLHRAKNNLNEWNFRERDIQKIKEDRIKTLGDW